MIHESIKTIDETSKQLVTVAAILEGLYFHAITFSNLRGTVLSIWYLALYLLRGHFLTPKMMLNTYKTCINGVI